jgi:hypothetical protein
LKKYLKTLNPTVKRWDTRARTQMGTLPAGGLNHPAVSSSHYD